jgi:hypothetical protein
MSDAPKAHSPNRQQILDGFLKRYLLGKEIAREIEVPIYRASGYAQPAERRLRQSFREADSRADMGPTTQLASSGI